MDTLTPGSMLDRFLHVSQHRPLTLLEGLELAEVVDAMDPENPRVQASLNLNVQATGRQRMALLGSRSASLPGRSHGTTFALEVAPAPEVKQVSPAGQGDDGSAVSPPQSVCPTGCVTIIGAGDTVIEPDWLVALQLRPLGCVTSQ